MRYNIASGIGHVVPDHARPPRDGAQDLRHCAARGRAKTGAETKRALRRVCARASTLRVWPAGERRPSPEAWSRKSALGACTVVYYDYY